MTLSLSSASFAAGDRIPVEFTCEGADRSPQLSWTGVPEGTRSFALVVDDPDAPDPAAPKMTWVHWVVYNLPGDIGGLAAGMGAGELPGGARTGRNGWGRQTYSGPCPPVGRHRYVHKLYALDTMLPIEPGADKDWLESAMRGHVLARAELIGTYQKQR